AHARVLSIETDRACGMPGVLAVFTAADVPGENDVGPARRDEPLFPTEVCFHGQAVAWVAGETEEAARLGAEAVRVEYEPLPAVIGIEAALAADSFLTELERMRRGQPEDALKAAPIRFQGQLLVNGQEHFYLETNA